MTGFEKFKETKLPPYENFYSQLRGENISKEDYNHAQEVWKEFKISNMQEYHDLYLKTDVLHLADIFENFRKVCQKNYNLDPAWYYTSPGLAWDSMLKTTNVKLELITDYDMILMIERGTHGGISRVSKSHAEANNKYMIDYDPAKPSKFLAYLDANSLYGFAMTQNLPSGGFKWMTEKEISDWRDIPCFIEADLEYPDNLHKLHNEYPLAPEKGKINGVEKLIQHLYLHEKYVCHHEVLKTYLRLGLKIKKIHRGIKFEESTWMKDFIDKNTRLRTASNTIFEKNFFKLMSNSVFGKTMENIRNRVDIKFVTSEKAARKWINKTYFAKSTYFSENFFAIHLKRKRICFNKPIYVGAAVLDISKMKMFEFHYDYIKPKYGDLAKLCYTDTDSLFYLIETKDFFKDISGDVKEKFDTSAYPKDHPSGIETGVNKKVLMMFKDEVNGQIILKFVGLRSKCYSFIVSDITKENLVKILECSELKDMEFLGKLTKSNRLKNLKKEINKLNKEKEEKKCKGITKAVVKNILNFKDYEEIENKKDDSKQKNTSVVLFANKMQKIYTKKVDKLALGGKQDDKTIPDKINPEEGNKISLRHFLIRDQKYNLILQFNNTIINLNFGKKSLN